MPKKKLEKWNQMGSLAFNSHPLDMRRSSISSALGGEDAPGEHEGEEKKDRKGHLKKVFSSFLRRNSSATSRARASAGTGSVKLSCTMPSPAVSP